jgi:RNA polymerase sigma-70 factor (ECF subfamily)
MELPVDLFSAKELARIARLLEHVKEGDEDALRNLLHFYKPLVGSVVLRITDSELLTERAMNETCLEVRQRVNTYSAPQGRFESWLLGRARRIALRWARTRVLRPQDSSEQVVNLRQRNPDLGSARMEERRAAVHNVIDSMPEHQRDVLVLAYFRGMTAEEIADRLSIPVPIVRELFRRSLAQIRDTGV